MIVRWLLLLLTCLSLPALAEVRPAGDHFFQQKMGDLKDDLATARAEGKAGILLMFEMDECPFCDRMKQTVLNQSHVQDYFRKNFIIYPMDTKGDIPINDFTGKDTTEKVFSLAQRARATPTFIFYDLDGNVMTRYTGATQTVDEFMLLGRYVVEGAYKTTKFTAYKLQQAQAR